MNQIILVGRLAQDVELRYIAGTGTPVATFTVAVEREFAGKDGKREVDFIDVQTWGKTAETCANYIGKGSLVCVKGSIRIDNYEAKDGAKKRAFYVNADRVQFLDSKKPNQSLTNNEPQFVPSFGDDMSFTAIDNDDLPF